MFVFGLVTAIAQELPQYDVDRQASVTENSYIYAADGRTVLAVLRGDENRVIVPSDRIAPIMKQAIVAIEDRRFYDTGRRPAVASSRAVVGRHRSGQADAGRLDDQRSSSRTRS